MIAVREMMIRDEGRRGATAKQDIPLRRSIWIDFDKRNDRARCQGGGVVWLFVGKEWMMICCGRDNR